MKFRKSTAVAVAAAAVFGLFGSAAPAQAAITSGSTTGSCSDGSSEYTASMWVYWNKDTSNGKYDITSIVLKFRRLGFEFDWATSHTTKIINAGNTYQTWTGNPGSTHTIVTGTPYFTPNGLKVTATGGGGTSYSCIANVA